MGREVGHNIAKPDDQVDYEKVPIFWSSVGKGEILSLSEV
jgi:hypothetical protein